ncbi:MAG: tetratricopeptide repeat protein [Buchnera aphidicola (Melaphis rhois)]
MFKKKHISINSDLNYTQKSSIFLFILIFLFFIFYYDIFNLDNNSDIENYKKIIQLSNIKNKESIDNLIKFINNNQNNIYSSLASLYLSKIYVNNKELSNALLVLKYSLKHTLDSNILNIITLNIAKIQFQLGNKLETIKTINRITDSSWNNIKNDFKRKNL